MLVKLVADNLFFFFNIFSDSGSESKYSVIRRTVHPLSDSNDHYHIQSYLICVTVVLESCLTFVWGKEFFFLYPPSPQIFSFHNKGISLLSRFTIFYFHYVVRIIKKPHNTGELRHWWIWKWNFLLVMEYNQNAYEQLVLKIKWIRMNKIMKEEYI